MTPFAIQCGSCGARLRVRKRSTIGQTLACPKCKHPIKVEPPADWVDDETSSLATQDTSSAATTPASRQENTLASSFEDVDSLLADVEHASPEQLAAWGAAPAGSPGTSAEASSQHAPTTSAPTTSASTTALPNDDWVSSSTKSRRQLLTVISFAVAGIVLSGILIIYLIYQMGRSATEVSQNDAQGQPNQVQSDPDPDTTPSTAEVDADKNDSDPNAAGDVSTNEPQVPSEIQGEREQTGDDAAGADPGDPSQADVDQINEDSHKDPSAGDANVPPTSSETQDNPAAGDGKGMEQPPGFSPDTERARPGILDDPILAGLEDLDEFTGDAGAGEAREALDAARRNDAWMLADADAPFIEPPRPREVDIPRQLDDPLLGLRSESISLYRYLELVSTLIGAPISLSPEAIRLKDVDHATTLDVNEVELSFGEALNAQLAPLGLTYEVLPNSIRVIPIESSTDLVEVTYPVEGLLAGFPRGFEDLQRVTEAMIEPSSWNNDEFEGGPSIARQGEAMLVRQSPRVQQHVQRFVTLLQHVRGLPIDGESADLESQMIPFAMADACLNEPASYELYQPRRLGDIVQKLIETQGVDIVIDWEGLIAEGWTMDTELPLVLPNATFEQVLRRVCGTLGISYRVLGPRQFELLPRTRAASESEFALFDISPLLDQNVEIDSIANQIQSAFPAADPRFANRFYYDAPSGYLLTRLSQDDQRALQKFLRAWQLTKQARGG